MNKVRAFSFAAIIAAAAGEAMQYGAPIDQGWAPALAARADCPALPALCTGAVILSGVPTALTYICPLTTTVEAATTVHVTVTATTTVYEDAPHSSTPVPVPAPAPSGAPTPHGPYGPTTTITIHSTMKLTRTYIVTRKTGSPSFPVAPTSSATPIEGSTPSATPIEGSATSTASSSSIGDISSFDLPMPTFSRPSWNLTANMTATVMPTFTVVGPTSTTTNNLGPSNGTVISMSSSSAIGDVPFPLPSFSLSGTAADVSMPSTSVNVTSTRGYQFPQVRAVASSSSSTSGSSSSTSTAAKATKTGSADAKNVSIAALTLGLTMAAYFV